jgi:hypothetical protein
MTATTAFIYRDRRVDKTHGHDVNRPIRARANLARDDFSEGGLPKGGRPSA